MKILILRLSSFGDVVLASSALEAISTADSVHWVVADSFAEILEGHPKLNKVWRFDRRGGLTGWKSLAKQLHAENYDLVLDLHSTIRSRLMQAWFVLWGLTTRGGKNPSWRRLKKPRMRLWGYWVFKDFWPETWRPRPYAEAYARMGGGSGKERPALSHLLVRGKLPEELAGKSYLAVMPGSAWPGKRWPVGKYVEVLARARIPVAVLGTAQDQASQELVEELRTRALEVVDGVGRWSVAELAVVLRSSLGYFGNDTGIAHLAEAVGARSLVILGPTTAQTGFGPWKAESAAVGAELWCRPCSKDGRACIRVFRRHECLKDLSEESVLSQLASWVGTSRGSG